MGYKAEMDTTTNKQVYRKARKNALASMKELHCSYCPYHKIENADGQKRISKPKTTRRSKNFRKVS